MKKSRFTEQQIVSILKQVESGQKVMEVCRQHGISDKTYYAWRSRYAGMQVSQLKRLREVEAENARLKKMYAELSLVHNALQDVVAKKL